MDYKDAIKRSKIPRFNWGKILNGKTLTTWCFLQFGAGATPESCFRIIKYKIEDYYLINPNHKMRPSDVIKNAQIGISARFSEWNRLQKLKR